MCLCVYVCVCLQKQVLNFPDVIIHFRACTHVVVNIVKYLKNNDVSCLYSHEEICVIMLMT